MRSRHFRTFNTAVSIRISVEWKKKSHPWFNVFLPICFFFFVKDIDGKSILVIKIYTFFLFCSNVQIYIFIHIHTTADKNTETEKKGDTTEHKVVKTKAPLKWLSIQPLMHTAWHRFYFNVLNVIFYFIILRDCVLCYGTQNKKKHLVGWRLLFNDCN